MPKEMVIIHYIPSVDRASGGTTAYMQLLSKELGRLVELHVVSHESANPVQMDNCQVHFVPSLRRPLAMKRGLQGLLRQLKPDVVHINGCWTPGCAIHDIAFRHVRRLRPFVYGVGKAVSEIAPFRLREQITRT